MILGTAGHIDHGKTSLVRALTGVDTDRLPEEKRRGITIELGFAPLVLAGVGTIGIVDVPGHEAFVRTMVAGASGIDLALVVIAADEGVMPQTQEHLAILELLGVRHGVVAITKADLVDEEWLALVKEDARAQTGRALPNAPIIATSVESGQGLPELRAALEDLAARVPARAAADLFRLPVDRAFTIKGTGTVVTGTVWSGRIARDEVVRILPGDNTARVRGVQGHGAPLQAALAGSRAAVALAAVDVADIPRGSTLVADHGWRPTTVALADVTVVRGASVQLRPRTWFRLHVGTAEVGVRIVSRSAKPDEAFGARIVLDQPVLLRAGDRFVIRTSAPFHTIAGGIVTDPYAAKRSRPWEPGLGVSDRLARLIEEAGSHGIDAAALPVRLGVPFEECHRLVHAAGSDLIVIAGRIVARTQLREIAMRLVAMTQAHQAEHSLELGIPVQMLRDRVHGAPEVINAALEGLLSSGELAASSGTVATADWSPSLSLEEQLVADAIMSILTQGGAEPPTVEEMAAANPREHTPLLRYLERGGKVVQVEVNRYYATEQLTLLIERLRAALANGSELSPGELRDVLGLSRKFLIPFLEYCDRAGYTNRSAAGRSWRGA